MPQIHPDMPTMVLEPGSAGVAALGEFAPNHIVAILLMAAGVLLLVLALRRGVPFGSPKVSAAPPPPAGDAAGGASGSEALRNVMRESEELATLLAEQVDRQAARLERLISEADERIRRLERLAAAPEPARARPSREDATDPLNQRIYEMADEGMPPVEIARALSQQTGKVELVLALRRR